MICGQARRTEPSTLQFTDRETKWKNREIPRKSPTDEMSVVNAHLNDSHIKFSVCVNEGQDKLPTMYWLPKLHKRPCKAKFITNSSSCTTTELYK